MTTSTAATHATGAGTAESPPLRRLPLPVTEPPYDDEREERSGPPAAGPERDALQGTLALAFVLPSGLPATPGAAPRRLALVGPGEDVDHEHEEPGEPGEPGEPDDGEFGPQATPRALLPEPRGWAARLVQALVEVQAGERPVTQLVRWTSEEVYATLARQARRVRPRGLDRHPGARPVVRPTVRSVHVCEPVDGVAEACAVVQRGARATAVALRLEGVDGRWQCTALEVG